MITHIIKNAMFIRSIFAITFLSLSINALQAQTPDTCFTYVKQFGYGKVISNIPFSADGKYFLTGSSDGVARLWSVDSAKVVRSFYGHTDMVSSVAFSPDEQSILTGSYDESARIWDINTGEQLKIFQGHEDDIKSVAFSPDGQKILTGSLDSFIKLWDVNTGNEINVFGLNGMPVQYVTFIENGSSVLACRVFDQSSTNSAMLFAVKWNIETGDSLNLCTGQTGDNNFCPFTVNTDGTALLTCTDNSPKIYSTESKHLIKEFKHAGFTVSVAFSKDGKSILAGSQLGQAFIFDVESGNVIKTFDAHKSKINTLSFSPDGKYIITSSWDEDFKLWDISTGEEVKLFNGFNREISLIDVSPDGKTLLTVSNGNIKLWDIETEEYIKKFNYEYVFSAAFSPDEKSIATGFSQGISKLCDISTGVQTKTFDNGHDGYITSVDFSPDGQYIATASNNYEYATIWDIETEDSINIFKTDDANDIEFSSDGKYTLCAKRQGGLGIQDWKTGVYYRKIEFDHSFTSAVYSPDSKYVLTGCYNDDAQIWDVETGILLNTFTGHDSTVTSVAFSPDGKYVLTGSSDKTAKLWNVETGEVVITFWRHFEQINCILFSSDGKYVFTGSNDGCSRMWPVDFQTSKQITGIKSGNSNIVKLHSLKKNKMSIIAQSDISKPIVLDVYQMSGRKVLQQRVSGLSSGTNVIELDKTISSGYYIYTLKNIDTKTTLFSESIMVW